MQLWTSLPIDIQNGLIALTVAAFAYLVILITVRGQSVKAKAELRQAKAKAEADTIENNEELKVKLQDFVLDSANIERKERVKLADQISKLIEDRAVIQAMVNALQGQLKSAVDESLACRQSMAELEGRHKIASEELAQLKIRQDDLVTSNRRLSDINADLRGSSDTLRKANILLIAQSDEKEKEVKHLETTIEALKTQIAGLTTEMNELRVSIGKLQPVSPTN